MKKPKKKDSLRYLPPIDKKGQQEIAGFVLIVVMVVIALVIFLVISVKRENKTTNSKNIDNLLGSLMEYTTECVVKEPFYASIRDLIGDCYEGKRCKNLNRPVCEYLNESLVVILRDLTLTESNIDSFEMRAFWENDDEEREEILFIKGGKCNQSISQILGGGPEIVAAGKDWSIKSTISVCVEN